MRLGIKIAFLLLISLSFVQPAIAEEIKLSHIGDVYTVPVRLNNLLTIDFMIDTGAADVGLPDELTDRLLRTGIINESDFKGSATYTLGDGSSIECRILVLRSIHIGRRVIQDVKASTCPGKAPLLLGQSFLKKLGSWALNYNRNALIVESEGEQKLRPPTYSAKDVEWMQKAAVQGDSAAQSLLGLIYYYGNGVLKDYTKAVEWFGKAAAQGLATAQYNLGLMYDKGEGVPKDSAKAVDWWQKAAAQGNVKAKIDLSIAYFKGNGVPKNLAKAFEWMQKAAAQGDAEAQSLLGLMYASGEGKFKDEVLACAWLNLAAAQGNLDGKESLEMVEKLLTPSQRAEAISLASHWKVGQVLKRK